MSVENALKFGELMHADEKVAAKVKEIGLQNVDALIRYAAEEHGLVFDKDDLKKLAEETGEKQELTEEQLEQLAGGVISVTLVIPAVSAAIMGGCLALVGGMAVALGVVVGVSVGAIISQPSK